MRPISACLLCLLLAGCNTMAGLGEDMQSAGENLQQSADSHSTPPPPSYGYPAEREVPAYRPPPATYYYR